MRIALFGKTGQVAREVQRRCPDSVALEVIGRDRADFSKPDQVLDVARALEADAVINAVAYTAVDKAEEESALAETVNGTSVAALGSACAEKSIPLVHISTDYVFPGDGDTPWKPDDATGPLGAYGASKLLGRRGAFGKRRASCHPADVLGVQRPRQQLRQDDAAAWGRA